MPNSTDTKAVRREAGFQMGQKHARIGDPSDHSEERCRPMERERDEAAKALAPGAPFGDPSFQLGYEAGYQHEVDARAAARRGERTMVEVFDTMAAEEQQRQEAMFGEVLMLPEHVANDILDIMSRVRLWLASNGAPCDSPDSWKDLCQDILRDSKDKWQPGTGRGCL